MRRHHEEIAAAAVLVPAASAFIPITIAIWVRVKEWRVPIATAVDRRESEGKP